MRRRFVAVRATILSSVKRKVRDEFMCIWLMYHR